MGSTSPAPSTLTPGPAGDGTAWAISKRCGCRAVREGRGARDAIEERARRGTYAARRSVAGGRLPGRAHRREPPVSARRLRRDANRGALARRERDLALRERDARDVPRPVADRARAAVKVAARAQHSIFDLVMFGGFSVWCAARQGAEHDPCTTTSCPCHCHGPQLRPSGP